ncbi:hypothetical protein [Candidatus Thiosymbion oneisti]|uniref:hypothetical protein n=1 Tax=Candidatus Thiosymbion oneisti TaxID=589554 RepID=UPI00105C6611|nr:hypothetical protein [Candidatus Thiosymbion oneisti]
MQRDTLEKILSYGSASVLVLIAIFSQFSEFLFPGKELAFLIIFAGFVSFFSVHIFFEVKKIRSDFNKCALPDKDFNCPYSKGGIKLITDMRESRNIFDDFTGIYHAYNAPLRFETSDLDHQSDVHARRYRSDHFERAYYYYPVLSELGEEEREIWVQNIYALYTTLAKKITEKEGKKITFYVPRKNANANANVQQSQLVTYFMGEKEGLEQCVTYIHNPAFSTDSNPHFMIVFYNDWVLRYIRNHIETSRKNLLPIIGINEFLGYLESNYPEACNLAKLSIDFDA